MTKPSSDSPRRLLSLDALRGFDMLWIVGGAEFVAALAETTDWGALQWIEEQCHHVEWNGFRFWDLIFPLFLFIAGVAMPFSLTRRLERGDDRSRLYLHVVRRGLLLVAFGLLYNGGSKVWHLDFEDFRYASVLGRIGLAYLGAGVIVLSTGVRGQILAVLVLLLGYWAALSWIPVPGYGAGDLAPGHTLTDWIDRQLLPGRLHRGDRDPEGILGILPAVATALLGALTGSRLRKLPSPSMRAVLEMLAAGALALLLGHLWDEVFPINKDLWSSSFVLWTAGWSLLLLALFYALIDVGGQRRLAFPLVVVGTNAITIYLSSRFIDFRGAVEAGLDPISSPLHPVVATAGALVVEWLLLFLLYRRRIFLRV